MNFATLKGLTIPEGNVTKITDASGRALWNAGPKTVKLNIAGTGTVFCYVQIGDGQPHYGGTTVNVPVGTVLKCVATPDTANPSLPADKIGTVILNGTKVAEGRPAYYEHVITTNTNIALMYIASIPTNYYLSNISIIETYGVKLNTVPNGTLTANATANIGSTVTLTPAPDEGYIYGGATVTYTLDGVEQTITLDANTTTFIMPAADVTVTPVWSEAPTMATVTVRTSVSSDGKGKEVYITFPFEMAPGLTTNRQIMASDSDTTVELPIGTVISCVAPIVYDRGGVSVNGASTGQKNYNYTVVGNVSINLKATGTPSGTYGTIEITEQ